MKHKIFFLNNLYIDSLKIHLDECMHIEFLLIGSEGRQNTFRSMPALCVLYNELLCIEHGNGNCSILLAFATTAISTNGFRKKNGEIREKEEK